MKNENCRETNAFEHTGSVNVMQWARGHKSQIHSAGREVAASPVLDAADDWNLATFVTSIAQGGGS